MDDNKINIPQLITGMALGGLGMAYVLGKSPEAMKMAKDAVGSVSKLVPGLLSEGDDKKQGQKALDNGQSHNSQMPQHEQPMHNQHSSPAAGMKEQLLEQMNYQNGEE